LGRRRPGLAPDGPFHEGQEGLDSVALYGKPVRKSGRYGVTTGRQRFGSLLVGEAKKTPSRASEGARQSELKAVKPEVLRPLRGGETLLQEGENERGIGTRRTE